MPREIYKYQDFVSNVEQDHKVFYEMVHKYLTHEDYEEKVELKKTGYAMTYTNKKTKKTILNYVTRKKGILVRLYGNYSQSYMELFDGLPDKMKKEIIKAGDCKRFIDDKACNSRCQKGTHICIDGVEYGKCRYSALLFLLEAGKYEPIVSILKKEVSMRKDIA